MAELNINLSDYKASGVYFLEIDNSIINSTAVQNALRLAVGFNMRGPFNRPVYVSNEREVTELFGDIDRRLERRGCFTNRAIRTMVQKAPIYALNLLSVDTKDTDANKDQVGIQLFSLDPAVANPCGKRPYAYMYDRTKFWVADDDTFVDNAFMKLSHEVDERAKSTEHSAIFGLGNCGTKDISIIVRKAENLTGFNVSFLDWYGSKDNIPYTWINPNDVVSDYFVQVIAIAGNWDASNYEALSADVVWKDYFDANGLKKDKLSKFLNLDAVRVIGNWTGCVIPEFIDKQGNNKSIDYIINKYCNETGLMFGVNKKAFEKICLDTQTGTFFYDEAGDGVYDPSIGDEAAYFVPDFVGHCLAYDPSATGIEYLSAVVGPDGYDRMFGNYLAQAGEEKTMFKIVDDSASNIQVGDYVRAENNLMARIVKKRKRSETEYEFTASDCVAIDPSLGVEIHKAVTSVYDHLKLFYLKGLKICNRHMPGFNAEGAPDNEAGVEKIYRLLSGDKDEYGKALGDEGIRKGLLNDNTIDFRYIVDTMGFGLKDKAGAKRYLTNLAREKKHCTAICNAPSMTQFAASDQPFFGDTYDPEVDSRSVFNVKYIPQGGNPDMICAEEFFTLPTMEFGADHCGFFAPYFKYADGSRTILVPPAADISNTFMNKFQGGNPYKTVANLNGVVVNKNIVGLEYEFDDEDRGYLENFGINPIIVRDGMTMIYGDRTTYQEVDSDLSFMHVREILNTIAIVCKGVLDDYVFTSNNATNRAEIVSRLNPLLSTMKDAQAIAKYEIQCDTVNNTKDIINAKACIVNIGVWIEQNMEKIIVPITLNRSTTA